MARESGVDGACVRRRGVAQGILLFLSLPGAAPSSNVVLIRRAQLQTPRPLGRRLARRPYECRCISNFATGKIIFDFIIMAGSVKGTVYATRSGCGEKI